MLGCGLSAPAKKPRWPTGLKAPGSEREGITTSSAVPQEETTGPPDSSAD